MPAVRQLSHSCAARLAAGLCLALRGGAGLESSRYPLPGRLLTLLVVSCQRHRLGKGLLNLAARIPTSLSLKSHTALSGLPLKVCLVTLQIHAQSTPSR